MTDNNNRDSLASVMHVSDDDYEVVINRGARDGVQIGHRYLVFGLGHDLEDPETGENLGQLEIVRGRGQVVHLQEKWSTIRCTDISKKTGSTRRIIQEQQNFYAIAPKRTIEEISPVEQISEPFRVPTHGDKAKPI